MHSSAMANSIFPSLMALACALFFKSSRSSLVPGLRILFRNHQLVRLFSSSNLSIPLNRRYEAKAPVPMEFNACSNSLFPDFFASSIALILAFSISFRVLFRIFITALSLLSAISINSRRYYKVTYWLLNVEVVRVKQDPKQSSYLGISCLRFLGIGQFRPHGRFHVQLRVPKPETDLFFYIFLQGISRMVHN